MLFILYYILPLVIVLGIGYAFFRFFDHRISLLERNIIDIFTSRSDTIPALFEVSKISMSRHSEIFQEILELRKKEFSLVGISKSFEGTLKLEQMIHHEINFIFQVCNKDPKLSKKKEFLYIRDIVLEKSSLIGKQMQTYKKVIEIYNRSIQYKNYTLIGLVLPFSKKVVL